MPGLDRSDLYLLLALFGGIALTLLVGLYFSGLLGGWAWQLRATSDRVFERAESFLTAVQEDRYADAWALMEPRYRASLPLAEFKRVVTGDPFLATVHAGKLGRVRTFEGATAVLSGSLTAAKRTLRAEIHLVRVDESWYVSEIVLGGRPSLRPVGQF